MNAEQLASVYAGATINSSLLNALVRVGTLLFDIGHALGGALRRTHSGKYC